MTAEEYAAMGGNIPAADIEKYIDKASRSIDSLTFNRIAALGFDKLTAFQKEVVKKVCFQMAKFEYENEDLINSVLQSYSINGVSMQFGSSWNTAIINGIAVRKDTYNLLIQTGLCYRGV